jgi:hypothetical protein
VAEKGDIQILIQILKISNIYIRCGPNTELFIADVGGARNQVRNAVQIHASFFSPVI